MQTFRRWILALGLATTLFVPAVSAQEEPFSQAELDAMLAPIALYPDSVLSHVLIAATYPLEVVQAARWSLENPDLSGEAAVIAVEDFDWDPSVKALTAFPELLARMDEDIEWTQRLGDAFLIQEGEVIAAIQDLRDRAYAQGHLRSNEHVRVVREERVIYIEPARTRTVYVPYYDPYVVYGSWWWDAYPPVVWHYRRPSIGVSFYWGTGYRIAPSFYFSSFHWARREVVVVHHHHYPRGRHFRSGREVARYREARHWRHNPHHRRGVAYHRRIDEARFVARVERAERRAERHARPVGDQRRWAQSQRRELNLRERQTSPDRSQRVLAGTERVRTQSEPRLRGNGQASERLQDRRGRDARDARSATRERASVTRSESRRAQVEARTSSRAVQRERRVERSRSPSDFTVERSRAPQGLPERGRNTRSMSRDDRPAVRAQTPRRSEPARRPAPNPERVQRSAPRRASAAPARSEAPRPRAERPARVQSESRAPSRAQTRQRAESRRSGRDGRRQDP
ncbi:DUF3300 domain-containing protein [Wenzhouxiangella marina]|uniref:Putative lipoprotein n=1 Tax=Wenzhouxiangella marina TaxID=1579979 RepID=A0A0K0XVJ2_9GAMM|nr:DUF3300 domain-containing protein [Wenzhouxiangella marina]AKS41646.1 Putative lipoprotein [Wenzhouxiangella marina]MBB6086594.1 hypothetical protein [Wenzhouxiangella marina]